MRRSVIIVAAVALASCLSANDSTLPADAPSDPATETFADNLHINLAQMTKTALGDYYTDLKVGTGATLTGPQVVVFSFETFLKNGVLVDQQLSVLKDLGTVVRGLQDGMIGMQVGSERVIVVPSALALGRIGQPPIIPANSTLVFDVILNQIP